MPYFLSVGSSRRALANGAAAGDYHAQVRQLARRHLHAQRQAMPLALRRHAPRSPSVTPALPGHVPFVEALPVGSRWPISLSHCPSACAVASGPLAAGASPAVAHAVGVDIEALERLDADPARALRLVRRVFGHEAARLVAQPPRATVGRAFLRLWTAYEAHRKAMATGDRDGHHPPQGPYRFAGGALAALLSPAATNESPSPQWIPLNEDAALWQASVHVEGRAHCVALVAPYADWLCLHAPPPGRWCR